MVNYNTSLFTVVGFDNEPRRLPFPLGERSQPNDTSTRLISMPGRRSSISRIVICPSHKKSIGWCFRATTDGCVRPSAGKIRHRLEPLAARPLTSPIFRYLDSLQIATAERGLKMSQVGKCSHVIQSIWPIYQAVETSVFAR